MHKRVKAPHNIKRRGSLPLRNFNFKEIFMCPYGFYKEEETYYPRLYCKVKDTYCIYSKRCDKHKKYIPLDNIDGKCHIAKEGDRMNIPKDAYYVKVAKQRRSGKYSLYVDIDGTLVKINTDFTEFNQSYIYLDKVDGVYSPSLTPIKKPKVRKKKTDGEK